MVPDLGAKQLELLRQLVPGLARLGVLLNPANAGHSSALVNLIDAAIVGIVDSIEVVNE